MTFHIDSFCIKVNKITVVWYLLISDFAKCTIIPSGIYAAQFGTNKLRAIKCWPSWHMCRKCVISCYHIAGNGHAVIIRQMT